jgi:hypothetical protein
MHSNEGIIGRFPPLCRLAFCTKLNKLVLKTCSSTEIVAMVFETCECDYDALKIVLIVTLIYKLRYS